MATRQLKLQESEIDFASTVASLITTNTGEEVCSNNNDCKHQNQSLIIEVKEEDGQLTIICLICDTILDIGQSDCHVLSESPSNDSINGPSSLCPCGNSELEKFDKIEESGHFSLVCKTCDQIQSFSDEKQSLKGHASDYKNNITEHDAKCSVDSDSQSNIAQDGSRDSLCSCGNNNPDQFDHIEEENHFSLYCKSCENVISFEENVTSAENASKSNKSVVEYSFRDSFYEDEGHALTMCSFCGNTDPKKFDHIEEESNFSLVCKACDHITSFGESEPAMLSSDMSMMNISEDAFGNNASKSLIHHPDARVVVCSVCEKMWNYKEDNSIPLEAEIHIHEDEANTEGQGSKKISSKDPVLCSMAPKWEKVKSAGLLKKGDHVCFWNGYWRHAIFSDVFGDKVSLIGYRFKPKCQIIEELFAADKFNFQRAVYSGETHLGEVVITRARSRLGEQRYNMLTNYARAFPRWCKTGYGGILSVPPSDLGAFHISQSEAIGHEQVLDLAILNVGDHIKWWRQGYHWHHAVVMNVLHNEKDKFVDVIHYTLMDIPNNIAGTIAKLVEKWKWVEVAVERLKWCAEDKKLVHYTSTLGTQCSFPKLQEPNSKGEDVKKFDSIRSEACMSSNRRSIGIQTDDWLENSTGEEKLTENQQSKVTKFHESLLDSIHTDMNMIEEGNEDVDDPDDATNHPDPGLLYKVIYSGSTYAVDIILEKAKSKIGEANYLLLKKNCEHFVTWCCTGQSKSKQVDSLIKHGTPLTSQGVKESLKMLEVLLSKMPETAPKIISTARASLTKIFKFIPMEVAAFAVFAIIEIIIKGINIYDACMACKNGTLSEVDRNVLIAKEISEGTCSIIIGGLVGWLLGYFIPYPILGNTIGVIIGAITGHIAGRKIGYKFAEMQKRKAIEAGKKLN